MYVHRHGPSGPHSIHDARQHAWARLVFGPGATAPNQRPHRGMLPDVHVPLPQRPVSPLRRLVRWLRGERVIDARADEADDGLDLLAAQHGAEAAKREEDRKSLAA
jgi:hypothetical protein